MLQECILTHTVDTATDLSSGIFNIRVSKGKHDSYQAFISSCTLSAPTFYKEVTVYRVLQLCAHLRHTTSQLTTVHFIAVCFRSIYTYIPNDTQVGSTAALR